MTDENITKLLKKIIETTEEIKEHVSHINVERLQCTGPNPIYDVRIFFNNSIWLDKEKKHE